MKRSVFALTILIAGAAMAQWNQSLAAGYRSVPAGQNIQATFAYDKLLWGEANRKNPIYGYIRSGLKLGGAPTAAAFVQIAPVAPLVIEIQKSATYRYTPSQIFACKNIYCYGTTSRTEAAVKLAFGYDRLVGYAGYLWREISLPESANPVLAEIEIMTGVSGLHRYNELTVATGLKLEENFAGILLSQGEFSEGKKRSKSAYGVYSWKYSGFDLTVGAGTYETDERGVDGTGVILAISKKIGEGLSLY